MNSVRFSRLSCHPAAKSAAPRSSGTFSGSSSIVFFAGVVSFVLVIVRVIRQGGANYIGDRERCSRPTIEIAHRPSRPSNRPYAAMIRPLILFRHPFLRVPVRDKQFLSLCHRFHRLPSTIRPPPWTARQREPPC